MVKKSSSKTKFVTQPLHLIVLYLFWIFGYLFFRRLTSFGESLVLVGGWNGEWLRNVTISKYQPFSHDFYEEKKFQNQEILFKSFWYSSSSISNLDIFQLIPTEYVRGQIWSFGWQIILQHLSITGHII